MFFTEYFDAFHIDLESERLKSALRQAQAILDEEEERFYAWYEGRDVVPRIQALKDAAAGNVTERLAPAMRRAAREGLLRSNLTEEIEGSASRMMNCLLFGMRSRLPEDMFRECLSAMEASLKTWKHN